MPRAPRTTGLNGYNPLAYLGVNPTTPPALTIQARSPTQNDYAQFFIGDIWIVSVDTNPATLEIWMLVAKLNYVSTWIQLYPAGPGGATEFPTDSGVANEVGGILNIFGDTKVTTSGAGNTVTLHLSGIIADQYTTDAGIAVPAAGNLDVFGGTGVNTTGAGAVITINVDGDVATSYVTDAGTAIPAANVLHVLGDGMRVATAGAGSTITISADADIATTYTTDAGVATPVANNLNIVGDGVITTSGAGSTVTIHSPFANYQVGHFTPTLTFGGASVGLTYQTQYGAYTRIGDLVIINANLMLLNKGSSTGAAVMGGLPFPCAGVFNLNIFGAATLAIAAITLDAGFTQTSCAAINGTTTLALHEEGSGKTSTSLADTNFVNNSQFGFVLTYYTGAVP